MIDTLDEKKQDVCKFSHSHSGARQQISSRDAVACAQAEATVLGTGCWEHSRGAGSRNGARERLRSSTGVRGFPKQGRTLHIDNKTRRCARLPGAQEPSHHLPAVATQP